MSIKEKNNQEQQKIKPQECFVIMPISDPEGYEKGHFERVYKDIFIPAISKAGLIPFRADDDKTTNLIQLEILRKLLDCPIALCDLSSRNPNVLFELGIRQAFDKPVILVQEVGTPKIFDISSIRCIEYRKERLYHEVLEDQEGISEALLSTIKSCNEGTSVNSIVRLLALTKPASIPEIKEFEKDPSLKIIMNELSNLRFEMRSLRRDEYRQSSVREFDIEKRKYIKNRQMAEEMMIEKRLTNELFEEVMKNRDKYRTMAMRNNAPEYRELAESYEHLYLMLDSYINNYDIENSSRNKESIKQV